MDFIDEQYLPVAKVGENRGEFSLDLERWSRSLLKCSAQFVGNDGCQRGLPQARRAVEQNMIKRLAARTGSFNGNREILLDLRLSNELIEPLRAELKLKRRIVLDRSRGNDAVFQVGIIFCECHWRRC